MQGKAGWPVWPLLVSRIGRTVSARMLPVRINMAGATPGRGSMIIRIAGLRFPGFADRMSPRKARA